MNRLKYGINGFTRSAMEKEDKNELNTGKGNRIVKEGGNTTGSSSMPDSELLIHKTFEKDYDAGIELLFRWYYAALCNHAIRFVSSREVAEDIVSEVFSALYLQKPLYEQKNSFRAWLFTCVRNKAFNYVRLELRRNSPIDSAERMEAPDQQPDEITEYEELYHDMQNAVNTLPTRRRSIYIMSRMEGKKHEEIALELGISVNTVKEHMSQALRQIRSALKEKWSMLIPLFFINIGLL